AACVRPASGCSAAAPAVDGTALLAGPARCRGGTPQHLAARSRRGFPRRSRQLPVSPSPASTLLPGRHPGRSDRTARGSAAPDCAWQPCTACAGVLALCSLPGDWSSSGHALVLISTHKRDQSRAPSLERRCGRRPHRSSGPLGLPPGPGPFPPRLIGPASARREPPGRVSPVPCRPAAACLPPTPGASCIPPVLPDAVCCLRRDVIG